MPEKTNAEDEPELELMFEPDQSATPAAVKPTSQPGNDILSQAATQTSGSQDNSGKHKQAAPTVKLSESPT